MEEPYCWDCLVNSISGGPEGLRRYFSLRKDYSFIATKFNDNLQRELSRIEINPEPKDKKLREQFYDQDGFYKLRKDFVEKVAAYVSEFMICSLLFEAGFNAKFVRKAVNEKKYDLVLENIPCDVKTMLDHSVLRMISRIINI
jgi:hypothetical protein